MKNNNQVRCVTGTGPRSNPSSSTANVVVLMEASSTMLGPGLFPPTPWGPPGQLPGARRKAGGGVSGCPSFRALQSLSQNHTKHYKSHSFPSRETACICSQLFRQKLLQSTVFPTFPGINQSFKKKPWPVPFQMRARGRLAFMAFCSKE